MWWEGRSSWIWRHGVSCQVTENEIWIWSESDSEMTWIYSWTWIASRSGNGYGIERSVTVTWRTWRSESWNETKISLCCESDFWSDCLLVHCCASLVPFSSWLSSWP